MTRPRRKQDQRPGFLLEFDAPSSTAIDLIRRLEP